MAYAPLHNRPIDYVEKELSPAIEALYRIDPEHKLRKQLLCAKVTFLMKEQDILMFEQGGYVRCANCLRFGLEVEKEDHIKDGIRVCTKSKLPQIMSDV